jgi:hypothetical protein
VTFTGNGYEIETEMLIKLARRGARIARVPVRLHYGAARSKLRPIRDTTRTCFLAVRYRYLEPPPAPVGGRSGEAERSAQRSEGSEQTGRSEGIEQEVRRSEDRIEGESTGSEPETH